MLSECRSVFPSYRVPQVQGICTPGSNCLTVRAKGYTRSHRPLIGKG